MVQNFTRQNIPKQSFQRQTFGTTTSTTSSSQEPVTQEVSTQETQQQEQLKILEQKRLDLGPKPDSRELMKQFRGSAETRRRRAMKILSNWERAVREIAAQIFRLRKGRSQSKESLRRARGDRTVITKQTEKEFQAGRKVLAVKSTIAPGVTQTVTKKGLVTYTVILFVLD